MRRCTQRTSRRFPVIWRKKICASLYFSLKTLGSPPTSKLKWTYLTKADSISIHRAQLPGETQLALPRPTPLRSRLRFLKSGERFQKPPTTLAEVTNAFRVPPALRDPFFSFAPLVPIRKWEKKEEIEKKRPFRLGDTFPTLEVERGFGSHNLGTPTLSPCIHHLSHDRKAETRVARRSHPKRKISARSLETVHSRSPAASNTMKRGFKRGPTSRRLARQWNRLAEAALFNVAPFVFFLSRPLSCIPGYRSLRNRDKTPGRRRLPAKRWGAHASETVSSAKLEFPRIFRACCFREA